MGDQNGFAEWGGYMEAKMTKLDEQFVAASAPFRQTNLFAGISIFVNGLTNPSADELKRIMSVHGGIYHHYQRRYTTYIIASNLPDVKVRNMDTSKIISAQWVVDCLAEKRIVDYTKYLLYTNKDARGCARLNFAKSQKQEPQDKQSKKEKPPDKQKIAELHTIKQELAQLNVKIMESKIDAQEQKPKLSKTSGGNSSTTARTAVDPKFLPEFYNNSRLHHIATLGADLKQYVSELREKHDESLGFPARSQMLHEVLQSVTRGDSEVVHGPVIMHIDMDCFFVSVGLRNHPHLRGQPVAVTHSKGGPGATDVPVHPQANRQAEMELFAKRYEQHLHNNILGDKVRNGFDAKMSLSEIASCSYEARSKGIRNGMFVGQAIKLCPELKTIPYDFDGYKEVSYTLYNTIAQYTLRIEAVSCDEMFVDLSDVLSELEVAPDTFVSALRHEVRTKTSCPCSAGVGANKLQARLATRKAKPDGQYYLEAEDVDAYMANIPAVDLPGIGSAANHVLKQAGHKTCGDLQQLSLTKLQSLLGKKCGETLYYFCRGIDNRPLNYEQVRKSVSAEVNYGIRFKEDSEVTNFLSQLCAEVHSRLCQIKRKTKCVTLKVMIRAADAPVETSKFMGHGVCDYLTKSETLVNFTNELSVITRTVLGIMKSMNKPPQELRGIGIQLTKLDQPTTDPSRSGTSGFKDNTIKNLFTKLEEKRKEAPNKPTTEFVIEKIENHQSETCDTKSETDAPKPNVRSKRPNVLTMLQQQNAKKQKAEETKIFVQSSTTNDDMIEAKLPDYIDPEVFAALPVDIRMEVLLSSGAQLLTIENEYANKKNEDVSAVPTVTATATANGNDDDELDFMPSTSRAARERQELRRTSNQQNKNMPPDDCNDEIDPNFLEALPPDIRAEIEADIAAAKCAKMAMVEEGDKHFLSAEQLVTVSYDSDQDLEPLAAPPAATLADSGESLTTTTPENIFMHPECKELLLDWIKTELVPTDHDVQLCCQYAREMVPDYLELFYDSIVYLRKIIDKKLQTSDEEIGRSWLNAYMQIVEAATKESEARCGGRSILIRDIGTPVEPK